MNIKKIYSAFLNDGDDEIMLEPFISENDKTAAATVKNAIRLDEQIRALAMAERITLKWICDVDTDDYKVIYDPSSFFQIYDEEYFRKYAQTVFADEARQKANEMEATNND